MTGMLHFNGRPLGRVASLRVSSAEFDLALKPEAAVERGFWRRVFWLHPDHEGFAMNYERGVVARFHAEEWMFLWPHPTEADADEAGRALDAYAKRLGVGDRMKYLRAEYFPDYPAGGGA